ncbi:MAG TPA: ATP-dependent DNA helicase RecG [Chloroflexi bacterium]|nr:ATP-dependent DNA helicase RecG [Chloroflexota bacterium]
MAEKPLETLKRILQQEARLGYKDRAVLGGLKKLAVNWGNNALKAARTEQERVRIQEVIALLRCYSDLQSTKERKSAIEKLISLIEAPLPPVPKTPVTRPQPAPAPAQKHPTPPPVKKPAKTPSRGWGLDSPIITLSGVGRKNAERLKKLGVFTIRDLLYLFPRRYVDYSTLKTINQLQYGEEVTVIGNVWDVNVREAKSGITLVTCVLADGTGAIEITWFNQPHLANKLKPGHQIVVSGKVSEFMGRLTFSSPEWEPLDKELTSTARIVPVYPLTKGLHPRWLRKIMLNTIKYWTKRIQDPLPEQIREARGLMDLGTALSQIHFPDSQELLQKARHRLAFDELLLIQLGVMRQKFAWQAQPGRAIEVDKEFVRQIIAALPFELTNAQRRALNEILTDISRKHPMSRLLQGDVGSGKTVVALIAMLVVVAEGYQAAMMAPTEILAEQHFHTVTELLGRMELTHPRTGEPFSPRVRLLIGSMKPSEKKKVQEELAAGEVDIIIGTHTLIQEAVEFANLGLAIIDEQHRFGVRQRAALRQKGFYPHVLVMSATPIPRTLALTIYGDLDISLIDEMPPGRQRVKTYVITPLERERAYRFIRSQVEKGRQAFIIYPLIEESESIDAKAAVDEYERLQKEVFPDLKLGLLHGRMKGEEKEAVMEAFRRGELNILVSTAVVEVGVDVPNATVMMIEGAHRFGLAQLHQFRGRVGRGTHQAYCILVADSDSPEAYERLKIVESVHDGFELAEKDLQMRGPGEFLGTRQSGLPDLKLARLTDIRMLEEARAVAMEIFREDPELKKPEHKLLKEAVERLWRAETVDIS